MCLNLHLESGWNLNLLNVKMPKLPMPKLGLLVLGKLNDKTHSTNQAPLCLLPLPAYVIRLRMKKTWMLCYMKAQIKSLSRLYRRNLLCAKYKLESL